MIYSPAEDSFLLQEQVRKYAKGKSFLDMGAGSGIQAETAIQSKAKSVLAADISQDAIKILKYKNIPAIKSNLFSKIKGKFEIIAFNPPYLPENIKEDKESKKTTTGGKRGDETIIKFLKQASQHLNPKGKILLVISSLTPQNRILKLLKKLKLKKRKLSQASFFMETLEVWLIYHNNIYKIP